MFSGADDFSNYDRMNVSLFFFNWSIGVGGDVILVGGHPKNISVKLF